MNDLSDTFYRDGAKRGIYRAAASRLIFTRGANESRRARSFIKSRAFAPTLAACRDHNARADAELLLSYSVLLTRDLLAGLAAPLHARALTGFANNSSKC